MRIIAGQHKGRNLFLPDAKTTRPTADLVKTSLFNILQNDIANAVVLDLFAGSGSLGLEALSRGANKCVFVEKDKVCYEVLKKNCNLIQGEKQLFNNDFTNVLPTLSQQKTKFDLVFLDPPYKSNLEVLAIKQLSTLKLLNADALVVVEQDCDCETKYDIFDLKLIDERRYGRKKLYFLQKVNNAN